MFLFKCRGEAIDPRDGKSNLLFSLIFRTLLVGLWKKMSYTSKKAHYELMFIDFTAFPACSIFILYSL